MTDTNKIAKAGTALGLATLLLIVCVILLSGCQTERYIQPPVTVRAEPLPNYTGGNMPAQQIPNPVLQQGQPNQSQYQW